MIYIFNHLFITVLVSVILIIHWNQIMIILILIFFADHLHFYAKFKFCTFNFPKSSKCIHYPNFMKFYD